MPVLNVGSRLELDDKAFLDSYAVLQEGILCDVFSQKCSGKVLQDKGLRSPLCCPADKWLDFMLSQRNLWPTFTTKGAPTEMITEKTFCKERRRLQAKHLWMDIKISWNLLLNQCIRRLPLGCLVSNCTTCFLTELPRATEKSLRRESMPWTRPLRSPGEVGAKSTVEKEGTYQLKRRRLLPDVRDPSEQGDEDVDMTDI